VPATWAGVLVQREAGRTSICSGLADENDTAALKLGQLRLSGWNERQEVVDLVRGCAKDENRNTPIRRTLLMWNSLIGCQKHIVTALFGGAKKLPVLHPLEARPFGARNIVSRK
jgi:hypothetical protein